MAVYLLPITAAMENFRQRVYAPKSGIKKREKSIFWCLRHQSDAGTVFVQKKSTDNRVVAAVKVEQHAEVPIRSCYGQFYREYCCRWACVIWAMLGRG